MNDAKLAVYQSLSRALGGKVIDPKWSPKHKQDSQERYLKQWVRDNWPDKKEFPVWVHDYVAKWKAEAAEGSGADVGADDGGAAGAVNG